MLSDKLHVIEGKLFQNENHHNHRKDKNESSYVYMAEGISQIEKANTRISIETEITIQTARMISYSREYLHCMYMCVCTRMSEKYHLKMTKDNI